jgi:hypothetical protein
MVPQLSSLIPRATGSGWRRPPDEGGVSSVNDFISKHASGLNGGYVSTKIFRIDKDLLSQAGTALQGVQPLYWLVGASASGKTTISRTLAARLGVQVYDMDAHIYGDYHARFDPARHPVNTRWMQSDNRLAWLLELNWEEFLQFNQAALPEYLDLLAEDLGSRGFAEGVLVDGGIMNPGLLAEVLPAKQILCLDVPARSSTEIWEGDPERRSMRMHVESLDDPEDAWTQFLDFDERIAATILVESRQSGIPVCSRRPGETPAELVDRAAVELMFPSREEG